MPVSRRTPGSHNDERNFFRIDDEVYLEFRVLTEVSRDQGKLGPPRNDARSNDVLLTDLTVVNAQIHSLIESIKLTNSSVARCLEAINKKIDVVAKAVSKTGEPLKTVKPNKKVNLSAGGVSFNVSVELSPNTPVEVRLAVISSNLVMTAYGEVTHCRHEGRDIQQPFRVGIKFPTLSIIERQALFAHVLGRHTEKLRDVNRASEENSAAGNPGGRK